LARKRALPLIVVEGEAQSAGLDPMRVMNAVVHSVERRLDVKGIKLKQR
jgi:hypothetical protein